MPSWATDATSVPSCVNTRAAPSPRPPCALGVDWLLYVQSSPSAQGGRGLGAARVFTRDGTLVASIAQEGMVRFPD